LGKVTYAAEATATIGWQIEGDTRFRFSSKSLGRIPIMVRSKLCRVEEHLRRVVDGVKKDSAWRRNALTTLGEDTNDMGGFFIINGNEKLVRLLIVQRRNFPMAFIRDAYEQTAPIFTKYACVLRCVRPDQTSHTVSVHYLIGGNMMIRFAINRKNFFIPAIALLKALRRTTDREIYSHLVQGREENTMLTERVMEVRRLCHYE
jgi:DNA-directed RNA polymerase I subunit RPA2